MPEKPKTLTILFPDLSPEEQEQADEILRRYFTFLLRLYERLKKEQSNTLTNRRQDGKREIGRTFTSEYDDTNI